MTHDKIVLQKKITIRAKIRERQKCLPAKISSYVLYDRERYGKSYLPSSFDMITLVSVGVVTPEALVETKRKNDSSVSTISSLIMVRMMQRVWEVNGVYVSVVSTST